MVIADVAVMPLRPYTGEDEMYKVVDACIEKIKESGLKYEIGAMSTTFEGEFEEVFDLIKIIHKIPFRIFPVATIILPHYESDFQSFL